jgi:hypothetical protein
MMDQLKNTNIVAATDNGCFIVKLDGSIVKKLDYSNVWCISALRDGRFCFGDSNGLLVVSDKKGKKTKEFKQHSSRIRNVIQLENGKICTSSEDNKIIIWK